MAQDNKYRHELKYMIDYAGFLSLRQRLRPVMKSDVHTGSGGRYAIHSVYFDNIADKALREKINGLQTREKFRIRYYNDDFSFINLEKKIKHNDLCLKISSPLTLDECLKIKDGDTEWMLNHDSELVRELYCKMRTQQLRPRVLVSYIREPYIYKAGNVRVTFDFCVRTSLYNKDFFKPDMWDISVMDFPGEIILEVKYDEFLPDIIKQLIQLDGVRRQAFSKYGACRKFG